jgi:methylmalonyl-CoA/ethylmalonyl-CoA epimerase
MKSLSYARIVASCSLGGTAFRRIARPACQPEADRTRPRPAATIAPVIEPIKRLELGDPYHVGIVVRDLDDAMNRLGMQLGVKRWGTFESEIPSNYRGAATRAGSRAAYGRLASLYVELVQPTAGPWTASAFLDERGEGVYHLGYWVDDVPAVVRRASSLGIGVDWAMEGEAGPLVAYLDRSVGVHVELVSSSLRSFIENLVA